MSIEIAAVRREAPATQANAYLNAGTNGPLSRYVAEAIAAANQSQLNDGRIGPGVYEKSNAISTELRSGDPSQSTTDRTFTGQKQDGTGLLYYNARFYDPALGTFLSPDTLVPDAGRVVDYNRFLYVRGNPLKYSDPSGHCPAPPQEMGPTICVALFIKPDRISAGPVAVHGDGRDFSSNSAPEKSRGYLWISLNSDKIEAKLNPSLTIVPASVAGHEGFIWSEPSEANKWSVNHGEHGGINVEYDLVISGPLEKSGTAPNLNGVMSFQPDGKGGWDSSFTRDGFPWAEAYYHDGKGNVQTIFQDPAARGNPYDLFAIEPNLGFRKWVSKQIQSATVWFDAPIVNQRGLTK